LWEGCLRIPCCACDDIICYNPPGDNAVEIVQELERQKSLGRIKEYGVSNFGKENLESFLAAGGKPVSNQVCYNLLARGCEFDILPICAEKGISVLAYSPLQQGLLSGKYLNRESVPEGRRRSIFFSSEATPLSRHGGQGCEELLFKSISEIKALCEEDSKSMSSTCLSWILRQKALASVIVGAASPDQVTSNTQLVEISDSLNERLTGITEPVKQFIGNNCDLWADVSRVK